jgi:peptidoglycan-associated lipoprotein
MFRRLMFAVPLAALVAGGSTACATKGFVRTSVGEVNEKVDSLGRSVEETQERTRQNAERIGQVDQRAQAAASAASAAAQSADRANNAAAEAHSTANNAVVKTDALAASVRRLVFEVVLSEDQGNFRFNQTELPAEAKVALDEMITELKTSPNAIYFEIEGHTDDVGPKEVNDRIGMERAEAVKRYLYEQHQIPLHKMNVISYGEDKPVAPNNTRDGRAQNRRVVIKVLA